jgi:hypothetical protein
MPDLAPTPCAPTVNRFFPSTHHFIIGLQVALNLSLLRMVLDYLVFIVSPLCHPRSAHVPGRDLGEISLRGGTLRLARALR